MSTKVELTLRKKEPGLKWKTLEGTDAPKPSASAVNENDPVRKAVIADAAPSYPTSSKSGPKNWDKVVQDITAKPKKKDGEEGEEEGIFVERAVPEMLRTTVQNGKLVTTIVEHSG